MAVKAREEEGGEGAMKLTCSNLLSTRGGKYPFDANAGLFSRYLMSKAKDYPDRANR